MYNLITPTKLRKSHARSQSTPYLQHPPSVSLSTRDHYEDQNNDFTFSSAPEMPELPTLTHKPASLSHPIYQLPPLATQDIQHSRPSRPASKIADWFSGESVPITFALIPSPTKEKSDPVDAMPSTNSERTAHDEKVPATRAALKPPIVSRFSLFASKPDPSKAQIAASDLHDEWHDLDIKAALHPAGPSDLFSPSAFKNLQQNAEGLLLKLQTAYKQRSQALHDVIAEKEAQAEELEGAEMRTRLLKLQLDDMTAKLAEQDQAMMDLVDQLAKDKQARREAADTARDIKPKTRPAVTTCNDQESRDENVQLTERAWKSRTSTASDLSIESDGSCAESLFSRHGASSPAMSMSSVSTMNSPEAHPYQQPAQTSQRYPKLQETSALFPGSRLLGIKVKTPKANLSACTPSVGCAKCKGSGDSEAWSLVGILKLENQGLKTRLGQLESTVDDCLDMVRGLF